MADSPTAAVVVYAVLRGRTTFEDGTASEAVHAGAVVVADADRPFRRTFPTGFAELALRFPCEVVDGYRPEGARVLRPAGLAALRVHALGRQLVAPTSGLAAESVNRVALDLLADLTTRDGPGDRFALARLLIDQHLDDATLSAARLARALQLSGRQLTRLFADAGTSFPGYLTDRRLLRAADLLQGPGALPVAEVGARCGFSSAAYFSRVFSAHHGVPPGRFRAG